MLHQVQNIGEFECLHTHHTQLTNLGYRSFGDRQIDTHLILFKRCDRGDNLRGIHSSVEVLPFDFLFGTISQGSVKGTSFSKAQILESLSDHFLIKFLQASELNIRHRGTLLYGNDDDITIDLDTNVLEQTQAKQRANGRSSFVIAVIVTRTEWQSGKNSPRFYALQTLNTNVSNAKWIGRP